MATIDLTHGKIYCPPRFLPYLEKHRIFELFHECVELLVQVRPKDHIQFLKNVLPCAAMKKDKQRIVFISPVDFDRETFSERVAECLGIQNMTRMTLELLTRDRLVQSKVKIEGMNETIEEESCICPGEGEYSPYLPIWAEEHFVAEALPESIREEEEEPPCVCICPCKLLSGKEQGDEKEGEGEEEEKEGEWKSEKPVCPHHDKHRKKEKKAEDSTTMFTGFFTKESENSIISINYGILAECEISSKGWILEDFPTTGEEAERLCALGVIPTHALRIVVNEEEEMNNKNYSYNMRQWKNVYKHIPVLEIRKGERSIEELARDMCTLFSVMPHRHAPMQLRVVLIGSRGSGMTTQGQKLAKKYGLVHVEFEVVMARVLEQDDEICKLYKVQLDSRPDPEVEAVLLERALLIPACRKRGWVLTGYPKNIDQMRMLDLIATPPNRIIFIDVPPKECFVRLYYRKTDQCLGDRYKIPEIQPAGLDSFDAPNVDSEVTERLFSTKNNNRKQIIHDIEQYFLEKKEMLAYCGKTASIVDGDNTVDVVFQMIEQIIINPAPPHPPRDPITIGYGVEESYQRLKKFRLAPGMFFNNLLLNPPERIERI